MTLVRFGGRALAARGLPGRRRRRAAARAQGAGPSCAATGSRCHSTATGGGVPRSSTGSCGSSTSRLPTTWEVMPATPLLRHHEDDPQHAAGWPGHLTADDTTTTTRSTARPAQLALDGDLVLIHDPQPAGVVLHRKSPGQQWLWRCHIDLSNADRDVWDFLAPSVAHYHAAVFSHVAFVPPLPVPAYLVPPSIDPLSDKNRVLSADEEDALLAPLGLPARKPIMTQVSRFDRIKDPIGVIDAFLSRADARRPTSCSRRRRGRRPGGRRGAEGSPRQGAGRSDVSVLLCPHDAHLTINALQRRSAIVSRSRCAKLRPHRVRGALEAACRDRWRRRRIPLQVIHERTGMLVRSIEGCAYQMARLLPPPSYAPHGRRGPEHVRDNFLHSRERGTTSRCSRGSSRRRRAAAESPRDPSRAPHRRPRPSQFL